MHARKILLSATAAAVAGGAALSGVGAAQAEPVHSKTIQADVDGDGQANRVDIAFVAPGKQQLTFHLGSRKVDVTTAGDTQMPLLAPRAVDVNGDGQQEVMIADLVGANTTTFSTWEYDTVRGKIFPVSTSDGARVNLFEGGGVAAVLGYSCAGGTLIKVKAQAVGDELGDEGVYDGERTTYRVYDGIASVVQRTAIKQAPAGSPLLHTDPATCA